MADQHTIDVPQNPFDDDNLAPSGGLWDGKIVTITRAVTKVSMFNYGDGKPVLREDGTQAYANVLEISAIADGEEVERQETYSAGGLLPTADGEGFQKADGSAVQFHPKTEMAKLTKDLGAAGFDRSRLWDAEAKRMKVSGLVDARFQMRGEDVLDKDGKVKTRASKKDPTKVFVQQKFWPKTFKGFAAHAAPKGNGVDAAALKEKAVEYVSASITSAGGKITRADLIKKLQGSYGTDGDINKVLALVMNPKFHETAPWKVDGTSFVLA